MTLEQNSNRVKLFLIKIKIEKGRDKLRQFIEFITYKPIGQKVSTEDPYGEENWNE